MIPVFGVLLSAVFRGKQPGFIMECTGSADFGKSWNFCCKYIGKAEKKTERKENKFGRDNKYYRKQKEVFRAFASGDEKEEMIDRYLERGDMYVLKRP